MQYNKILFAVCSAVIAFLSHMPNLLHKLAAVALFFLVLDTVTGYVCAAFDRNWSSHMMRVKMVAKCSQYALLLGIAAGASLLMGTWDFLMAAWGGIIAIEAHSNLENMIRWQQFGVDLGPAAPLLAKLAQFFDAGQLNKGRSNSSDKDSETK